MTTYTYTQCQWLCQITGQPVPLADCLAIGTVVGSASPAGGLVALACAASRALANQGPVLCLGNQDDSPRAALLVRPLAVPPPGQPPRT